MYGEAFWQDAMWDADPLSDDDPRRAFLEDEADYAQGKPPPVSTNEVASQLLALARAASQRGGQPPARGFVAFGVGQQGVQAEPTGNVRSLVDVQFNQPGAHVNLEVDRPGQINTHAGDHLRAMRAALQAGLLPATPGVPLSTRSVFTTADAQGRIRQIRHVHYEVRQDRSGRRTVVPVVDSNQQLARPMSPQQAWRAGLLQPRAAARPAARRRAGMAARTTARTLARAASRQRATAR